MTEIARFLHPTGHGIVTIQSVGVDVDEMYLIPGLSQAIVKAGVYQIWIASLTEDLVRPLLVMHHVPPGEPLPEPPGTTVLDQVVEFYDEQVWLSTMSDLDHRFTLPEGAGRYRVVVTTDPAIRQEMMRFTHYGAAGLGIEDYRERDGEEWYALYFQYVEAIPDDDDDDT